MTPGALARRFERHTERLNETEKLERWRLGRATAALVGCWAKKQDGSRIEAWDVFPELQDDREKPTREVTPEENAEAVKRMFQGLAARQQREKR